MIIKAIMFWAIHFSNACYLKSYKHNHFQPESYKFICQRLDQSSTLNESIVNTVNRSFSIYFRLSGENTLLDKTFDFANVIKISNLTSLQFRFIRGFYVGSLYDMSIFSKIPIRIELYYSHFSFYSTKNLLTTCSDLKEKQIGSIFQTQNVPLKSFLFYRTNFGKSTTCPLVFSNATIEEIEIYDSLVDTFFKSNVLKFSEQTDTSLNSNISSLVLRKFYLIDIDQRLLDVNVFENLIFLQFYGEIASIERGLFKSFRSLKVLTISALFYHQLARRKGIDWLHDLNSDVRVNFSDPIQLESGVLQKQRIVFDLTSSTPWHGISFDLKNLKIKNMFRDEDFCLYARFPLEQAVVLHYDRWLVDRTRPCTFVWLIQHTLIYYEYSKDMFIFDTDWRPWLKRLAYNLTNQIKACDFKQK